MPQQTLTIEGNQVTYEPNDQIQFCFAKNSDLFCIKKYNCGSNSTEIHVLSGTASKTPYANYITQVGTAFAETGENWHFIIDSERNLIGILMNTSGSGKIEIHRVTAASNYTEFDIHMATSMPEVYNNAHFLLGPNDDIYCFIGNTLNKKFDLSILEASSQYSSASILQEETTIPFFINPLQMAMCENGNSSDLLVFNTMVTESVIATCYNGESNYSFKRHNVTGLKPSGDNSKLFTDAQNNMICIHENKTKSNFTELEKFTFYNPLQYSPNEEPNYSISSNLWVSGLAAANTNILKPAAGQIALYSGLNQTGKSWLINNGLSNITDLGVGMSPNINNVCSFALSPGMGIKSFTKPSYVGATYIYAQNGNLGLLDVTMQSLMPSELEAETAQNFTYSSLMTEDYHYNEQKVLQKVNTYQTIFSFAPGTESATIYSNSQVVLTVSDQQYTIDPTQPATFEIPITGKLIVSTPASILGTASYAVTTNLMNADVYTMVYPDAHMFHKVANLPVGSLAGQRATLNISGDVTDDDCNQIQKAMSNVASAAKYPLGNNSVTNALNNKGMSDNHWTLSHGPNGHSYTPLKTYESAQILGSSSLITVGSGTTSFWDDISNAMGDVGNAVESAATFTLHTVETAAENVIHAPEAAYLATKSAVADIASGNVAGALETLGSEGMSLAEDVSDPLGALVGSAAKSAIKKVVMATISIGEKAVSFVVHHTGIVGELLGSIIQGIELTIEDAISWLLDLFGWGDVVRIQKALLEIQSSLFQKGGNLLSNINMVDYFSTLNNDVDSVIESFTEQIPANIPGTSNSNASTAQHRLNWMHSKISESTVSNTSGTNNSLQNSIPSLQSIENLENVLPTLFTDFENAFKSAILNPQNGISDLAKATAGALGDILEDGMTIVENAVTGLTSDSNKYFLELSTLNAQNLNNPFLSDLGSLLGIKLNNFQDIGSVLCAIPMAIFDNKLFTNQSISLSTNNTAEYSCTFALAVMDLLSGIIDTVGDATYVSNKGEDYQSDIQLFSKISLVTGTIELGLKVAINFVPGGANNSVWAVSAGSLFLNYCSVSSKLVSTRYGTLLFQILGNLFSCVSLFGDISVAVNQPTTTNIISTSLEAVKPGVRSMLIYLNENQASKELVLAICATDLIDAAAEMVIEFVEASDELNN